MSGFSQNMIDDGYDDESIYVSMEPTVTQNCVPLLQDESITMKDTPKNR